MKKLIKKIVIYGGISILGYFAIRKGLQAKDVCKLGKALPDFLNNVVGEFPNVDVNFRFSTLSISVGFNSNILEEDLSIEDTILEYIEDFYPSLSEVRINVNLYATNSDNDSCNCGCNCDDECECEEDECECGCEEETEKNESEEENK